MKRGIGLLVTLEVNHHARSVQHHMSHLPVLPHLIEGARAGRVSQNQVIGFMFVSRSVMRRGQRIRGADIGGKVAL